MRRLLAVQGLTLTGVVSRKPEARGTLDITVFLVGNPVIEPLAWVGRRR